MTSTPDLSRLDDIDGPDLEELGGFTDDTAPNPVDFVVFDIGNVLIRWEPLPALEPVVGRERADAFLAEAAIDFHGRNLRADGGTPWSEIVAELTEHDAAVGEVGQAYVDHYADAIREPIDGTVAILRELHEAQVPLFAVTNFSAELFPIARELHDFLELFEEIIVSGEEGVTKPDPEMWEILEEVTRHIGGLEDAVFIDDSSANVMSAEQAGLDALLFTDPDTLRDELLLRGLPLAPIVRDCRR